AYKLLAQYIVDNKTSKEVQNLHFVQERFEEVGANFLDAQLKLASFRDKNQNIMLSSTRITEERLQAEFNLQNTLYNNLAMQLEQAKIKVQERTPVFSLINPAIVSSQPSKPNIPLIMALMVVMGFIVSFLWLLVAFIRNEFSTAYRA